MNVLCIGAHCDDLEIGCGGAILHHVNEGDVVVSLVMSGSEIRVNETKKAGSVLGISGVHVSNFVDTQIPAGFEAIEVIEEIIQRTNPVRVYTHSTKDTHQDHRNTGLATLSAARNVHQILFYQSALPKSWSFTPNYYINISKYMKKKIDAVKLFKSQADKWFMQPNVLRSMARFRGIEVGVKYAEAFEVYKLLGV